MNKKTGISIVVVAIIIILAIILGISHKASAPGGIAVKGIMMHGSMKDLLASNQSVQCSISVGTSTKITQGTVYVGDGKFRGDFTENYNGTSTSGHVISDGRNAYVWMGMMTRGFMMAVPQGTSTKTADPSQGVDVNASYDYSCSPWTVDTSILTPPSNIDFQAVGTGMMGGAVSGGTTSGGANSPQCAACSQAPAQYQSVCEAQFCK